MVLHLIDSAGLYGAEQVVLMLLDELKESSVRCTLGCIREKSTEVPRIAEEAQRRAISVELFTMSRGFNLKGMARILRYTERNDVHIIHSHGYKPNILLSILPHKGVSVVSTVHGWSTQTGDTKGRIYQFIDSLALKKMDKVIAVSQSVFEDLLRRGVSRNKITTIYNGITFNDSENQHAGTTVRTEHGVSENTFVIGAVGRLAPIKGYEYLIEAMASAAKNIPDWKLFIAGEGPLKDDLVRKIAECGLTSHITLVGYQSPVSRFLSMLDVFVMPSLSEGLPIALLEAMSCGKPVLASSVGGIKEVVTNGENGVLLPAGDSEKLAQAIVAMYRNRELRDNFSRRGKALVVERFTAATMARQYLSVYQDCSQLRG